MLLRCKNVVLEPPRREDLDEIYRLSCESDLANNTFPLQIPRNMKWFEERFLRSTENISDRHKFLIKVADEGRIVGTVDLFDICLLHRSAEIGYQIYLSGDRRKKFASNAVDAVLEFGFGSLGIHRIQASVLRRNSPSLTILLSKGFISEGLLRQSAFVQSVWEDKELFSILSTEYRRDNDQNSPNNRS